MIPETVLELADGAIVRDASGLANRLDAGLIGGPDFVQDFEHLGLPPFMVRLGHDPELPSADVDFSSHRFRWPLCRSNSLKPL